MVRKRPCVKLLAERLERAQAGDRLELRVAKTVDKYPLAPPVARFELDLGLEIVVHGGPVTRKRVETVPCELVAQSYRLRRDQLPLSRDEGTDR